ncbi:MAG: serine/threonine-protein kinase RIO2 [Candidatus Hecatellaceae archaeon]
MSFKEIMRNFREMEARDFKVLAALEAGMERYEIVPVDFVEAFTGLPREEVTYRLDRAERFRLARRSTSPYLGYSLNYFGLDFLALNSFTSAGLLEALGDALGVGKEADVYEALTPEGEQVAVKFHRLGRVSFRQTARVRGYTAEKAQWLIRSKAAARREYEALRKLHQVGVAVTRPRAHNRHAILMDKIVGVPLAKLKELPEPRRVLQHIIENVALAYREAKIIHADLSEFNVLVSTGGSILIIDWPQHVTVNHPNAEFLLKRDLENLLKFFWKKFRVKMSLEEVLRKVKG